MKKAILTLALLLPFAAPALTKEEAGAICRNRVESFLEIVKENKEAQLTVGIAMQLMLRLSDSSPDEVSKKFITMLFRACYDEMLSKERA
jgi:hypothetical protein